MYRGNNTTLHNMQNHLVGMLTMYFFQKKPMRKHCSLFQSFVYHLSHYATRIVTNENKLKITHKDSIFESDFKRKMRKD